MSRHLTGCIARIALLVGISTIGIVPVAKGQHLGDYAIADTDHDGKVTFNEFATYEMSRVQQANGPWARRFRAMPQDQQAVRMHAKFETLDKNHKGFLVRQDWLGE